MSYGVKLRVWGNYACFTRPEMKVERVSYDVITPSAARAILEAIYWKPSIRWVIDRIHVLKPIKFTNIRRNELGSKISVSNVKKAMRGHRTELSLFIEDNRQQRAATVLKDVEYVIEAHFEVIGKEDVESGKHTDMFKRRARKGQCFKQPYLGCREFTAYFELLENGMPIQDIQEDRDFDWMLYDIDFKNDMKPMLFKAKMCNGIIEVPAPESEEVIG